MNVTKILSLVQEKSKYENTINLKHNIFQRWSNKLLFSHFFAFFFLFRLLKFFFQYFTSVKNLPAIKNSIRNNGQNIKNEMLKLFKVMCKTQMVDDIQKPQFSVLPNYWMAQNVFQNCLKYYLPSLSLGGLG